jgi:hypothetical protein
MSTGAPADTFDYDAFGNLIHSAGWTPNFYLFVGEQSQVFVCRERPDQPDRSIRE